MYELVAQNGAWWVYDEQVECWYGGRSGKPQKMQRLQDTT